MNICFTSMQFNKALQYSIISRSINVLILFLINLLFVRITGAKISGDFFYVIAILSFITLIISCSLEAGITFYASRNPGLIPSFTWFILLISLAQALLGFTVISLALNNIPGLSYSWLLLFIVSNTLISNYSALYFSRKWFFHANTIVIIVNSVALVLLWIILYRNAGYVKAEKVYLLNYVGQAALLILFFIIKDGMNKFKILPADTIQHVFKYSFIALLGNISFFLVTRLDYIFVKTFCTGEALGNYVQVSKIGQLFVLLPVMAASVIFPFTANNTENTLLKVQWLCRVMTLIVGLAGIFLIITGKWLFPWLFGREFNLMYLTMLFYLPGIFALCITSLLASYVSGKGFILINVTGSVIALAIVIIGDIIFIPGYGINAAAIISSIGYVCCMLYLLRHYMIKYNSKPAEFFRITTGDLKYILPVTNKKRKLN